MSPLVSRPSHWCLMATVQVADTAPDLASILADLDVGFSLEPAAASPPGYRWLNLLVDARRGERRCAYAAHRLLSALQRIADTGELPGFHIIAGERWLDPCAIGFSPTRPTTEASLPAADIERRH